MKTYILRRAGNAKETCDGIIAKIADNEVSCVRNDKIAKMAPPEILIRWNSKEPCQAKFEINTIDQIRLVNDKPKSRKALFDAGVPVPVTYYSKGEVLNNLNNIQFPVIGRLKNHSQGREMQISHDIEELKADNKSVYFSEYIPKDKEYRIVTFFGRVLSVCEKIPHNPQEIAWNASLGNCVFKTIAWKYFPKKEVLLALKASKELNLDFSAIDLVSRGKDCWVIECNAGPECSEYRQECIAKAIKWLKSEIEKTNQKPKHFELPVEYKKYKHVLHPCLMNVENNENLGEDDVEEENDWLDEENQEARPPVVPAPAPINPVNDPLNRPRIADLHVSNSKVARPQIKEVKNKEIPDETHKLQNITDLELRSIGESLMIYGKILGTGKHIKIMEIENPKINFWWED